MGIMSRCSSLAYGLLATLLFAATIVNCLQYSSNMFLNGEYQNSLLDHPEDEYRHNAAAAFISLISKRATPFVGQKYLPSLLECREHGQQCVRKNQCINGYFSQQLPKIQSCDPEDNVCCTYKPPTPPPTTQKPFSLCSTNMACVAARDCRNGEILSNAVVNLENKKCYEPNICCGISSTMLTKDGYVLKTPPKPFTYPSNPTKPIVKEYLPPKIITTPKVTRKPQTTTTTPRPTQPPTPKPTQRPPRPQYLPPTTQAPRRIPTTYLPPPIRGEDQLSPQIFPTIKRRPFQPKFQEQASVPFSPAKCASALVCTPENYCNPLGVISETPVEITPFRVAMTDCVIEETGAPGKCCRDPNYVDPWPVNMAGVCATRNRNTKPQGIKDIDANFAEIPWQAMILKESSKTLLCGGAIIGDGVVLTTASCVQNVAINDIRVKAGEWELGSTTEPLNFQLVGVKNVAIHPNYDAVSGSNDMAVLHLTDRLQFASHIQPICISDKDPSPSETCITTGWGKQALSIHEEGAIMHITTTKPVSRSECGADANSVCSTTTYDACEFDSGSALACGTGSNVLLKGIYGVENACGEGQTVRFIKPDIAWVNKQFLERSKPLLLKG